MKSILDGFSPVEKDEIVSLARDYKESKLLKAVFDRLQDHYAAVLVAEPTYSLTAVEAHASLRVLEQVHQEICNTAALAKHRK